MKFITHTLLAVVAAIGFYLIMILPESAWMDKHGFAPGYKATWVYYGSYVLGGILWAFVLWRVAKGLSGRHEDGGSSVK